MRRAFLLCMALGLLISQAGYGQQIAKVGTVGAQFLKLQVGARGIALGDAYTVLGDDAASIFWNPAGLNRVEKNSLFFSHTEWIADIQMEAGAFAKYFDRIGTLGVSFAYLTSGQMEETTVEQQDGTGRFFSTSDLMIGASFARMLTDKFGIGINLKMVREDLGVGLPEDFSDTVWGVDVGSLYDTGWRTLRIGLSIRNFGPEIQIAGKYEDWDNGQKVMDPLDPTRVQQKQFRKYHMPLTFQFGLAMDPMVTETSKLSLSMVGEHPNDNLQRVNMGGEYWFQNILALRAGYSLGHDTKGLSWGAGLKVPLGGLGKVKVDYAYSDFRILDAVQMGTITIEF